MFARKVIICPNQCQSVFVYNKAKRKRVSKASDLLQSNIDFKQQKTPPDIQGLVNIGLSILEVPMRQCPERAQI